MSLVCRLLYIKVIWLRMFWEMQKYKPEYMSCYLIDKRYLVSEIKVRIFETHILNNYVPVWSPELVLEPAPEQIHSQNTEHR